MRLAKKESVHHQHEIAVYEFYQRFFAQEGYTPTGEDAGRMMGISAQTVGKAVRSLAAQGFLVYAPRKWASVRLIVRCCADCGAAITPKNAAITSHDGKDYIRRVCSPCFSRIHLDAQLRWRANNPGYSTRWQRNDRRVKRLGLDRL